MKSSGKPFKPLARKGCHQHLKEIIPAHQNVNSGVSVKKGGVASWLRHTSRTHVPWPPDGPLFPYPPKSQRESFKVEVKIFSPLHAPVASSFALNEIQSSFRSL